MVKYLGSLCITTVIAENVHERVPYTTSENGRLISETLSEGAMITYSSGRG